MFSDRDKQHIAEKNISPGEVALQLDRFRSGFPHANIAEPATLTNGIRKLTPQEVAQFGDSYEAANVSVMKFVPASGAATRMFKNLFAFLEEFDGTQESLDAISREEKRIGKFFADLDEFAFHGELEEVVKKTYNITLKEAKKQNKHNLIVEALLAESGLQYGALPKGLLSFHKYQDHVRTAAQEHLAEGISYAEKNGEVSIHFTVSPSHLEKFKGHISASIKALDSNITIQVDYSTQKASTDTIASTTAFEPFRDEQGNLLFRPAGHGALLENLNALSADLIFINNIDNVVPDSLRQETIRYKKALAGILLEYQEKTFDLLRRNEEGEDIQSEAATLLRQMGIRDFDEGEIIGLLNRPIRVCGMVKNEGEPGGGPFWVRGERGLSLQIVESAQVDKANPIQLKVFKSGTHFNPVDLVCGTKNYKGQKFDLLKFRDNDAGFISEKSYNGQTLLAMELPGLWNGSMADWNTIFVEVPLITFNPVKTVTDLLKPTHRQVFL
ncbi:MAG: DUF4301 family protein [Ekhidna sp.]|uniref:DUF4301 family protein n=1 Tax=Ekhidna sp. TaxID=2608089 RepID=UPI0032EABFFE